MKLFLLLLYFIFNFNIVYSDTDLLFYLDSAFKNNLKLNAERENLKATRQDINISKSEFLPSISIIGTVDDTNSTNRTNQSGTNLADTSTNTKSKKFLLIKKFFRDSKDIILLKNHT